MTIKFYVTTSFLLARKELKLKIGENEIVGNVIKRIMEINDDFKKALLDPDGNILRKDLLVIVNSKEIPYPMQLRAPLKDGDIVTLLQIASGG